MIDRASNWEGIHDNTHMKRTPGHAWVYEFEIGISLQVTGVVHSVMASSSLEGGKISKSQAHGQHEKASSAIVQEYIQEAISWPQDMMPRQLLSLH